MKVGDLVKYTGDATAIGLIIGKRFNGAMHRRSRLPRSFIYDVIIRGVTYPFSPAQLEVVSESR